jgi:hypothetical protein
LINQLRRHRRLIALQVDDNLFVFPVHQVSDLGNSFGSGVMMIARHAHDRAECLRRVRDALVIRRDDDLGRSALHATLIDMLDHRLAADIPQRLSG